MWWVVVCVHAGVPVTTDELGSQVVRALIVKVGAEPARDRIAQFSPNEVSVFRPANSKYEKNGTDLLYVDNAFNWVPMDADGATDVLGSDALSKLSEVWSYCDGQLELQPLPRRCRKGDVTSVVCEPNLCKNHYSWELRRHALPVLSLYQLNANVEYDASTKILSVWLPDKNENELISVLIFAGLVTLLSIWQRWTAKLTRNYSDRTHNDALYSTVAANLLLFYDMLFWPIALKFVSFVTGHHGFAPQALDDAFGIVAATAYSWWYLIWSSLFSFLAVGLILYANVEAPPAKTAARLLVLRWLVETLLLTSMHIAAPSLLGERVTALIGIGSGAALCALAGRDAALASALVPHNLAALSFAVLVVLIHAAFFMILPVFAKQQSTVAPAALAVSVSVQAAGAGAFWARRAAKSTPAADRGGQVAQALASQL